MAAFPRFSVLGAFAALALAACGAPGSKAPGADAPKLEAAAEAGSQGEAAPLEIYQPQFVRDHIRMKNPYWVSLLQQPDGGVIQQAPQTVFRYPDRTAEIWIQILHPAPLKERFEDAQTFEDITFQRERYRYVFNCPRREFTVTERRIMGDGETIVRTVTYEPQGSAPQWRQMEAGGPAPHLYGPACAAP